MYMLPDGSQLSENNKNIEAQKKQQNSRIGIICKILGSGHPIPNGISQKKCLTLTGIITRDASLTHTTNQPGPGMIAMWLDRWASPCGERNGKKRILPVAAGSRQHALMREEAGRKPFVGSIALQSGRAAGKKSARRWLFSLAIQNQVMAWIRSYQAKG